MNDKINVAIDGPSGAGKSTIAKMTAKKFGFIYVDTGALYRTLGVFVYKAKVSPRDENEVSKLLQMINIEMKYDDLGIQRMILNGEDVSEEIRLPEMSKYASDVSAHPSVRAFLLGMQRNMAEKYDVVMDGRDIGTVVLPEACVKIFLTASAEERAKRRYKELIEKGINCNYEEVYSDMLVRDKNDSERAIAPLRPAEDSETIDTTGLNLEQSFEKAVELIKKEDTALRTVYTIYFYILYPFFWLLFKMKPMYREKVVEGPALICANHTSYADIIFLSFALGKKTFPRYVAKKELIKIPIFGWLIKKAGVIGIDRGNSDITAIKEIMKALKDGYKVMIFPEGTRTEDDKGTAKTGAIMIASKTGVPIIPVFIPRIKKLFSKISVVIGEPYYIEKLKGGSDVYGTYADELMSKISALQSES